MPLCPGSGHTHCRDGGDGGGGPEWNPHQGRRTTGDDPQGLISVTVGLMCAGRTVCLSSQCDCRFDVCWENSVSNNQCDRKFDVC